ncbi:tetratricopeptide repeat protein [Litoribrevibacter albus]|uniref:MSHA biogenesis protein MshN n=1 Tax=Litoribrevibacter albus TaxID=1473156 RepID=A0AA37SF76_9GAMM|nr:hypothetical protein [Litoribrevibacter albus]GLQ33512.1 MSHA biogenesis protein MshN [Litoribrevibacter albus]
MSLINDVLKDLDKKPENANVSVLELMQTLHPSAKPKKSRWLIFSLFFGILVVAGLAWGYLNYFNESAASQPALASNGMESSQPGVTDHETVNRVVLNQVAQPQVVRQEPEVTKPMSDAQDRASSEFKTVEQSEQPTSLQAQKVETEKGVSQKKALQAAVHNVPASPEVSVSASRATMTVAEATPVQTKAKPTPVVAASEQAQETPPADVSAVKEIETAEPTQKSEAVTSVSKQKTQEVRLYEQALSRFQQGRYQESQVLVDQLLKQAGEATPQGNVSKYQALKARLLLKESPNALVTYIDQQKVDISSTDELLGLAASAYQRTNDHIRAVKAYDLLVQRQPTEGRWWLAMAFSLEAENALDKSLKAYSLALQSGNLPANAREFAARKANQISKQLEALAQQAKEQQ